MSSTAERLAASAVQQITGGQEIGSLFSLEGDSSAEPSWVERAAQLAVSGGNTDFYRQMPNRPPDHTPSQGLAISPQARQALQMSLQQVASQQARRTEAQSFFHEMLGFNAGESQVDDAIIGFLRGLLIGL